MSEPAAQGAALPANGANPNIREVAHPNITRESAAPATPDAQLTPSQAQVALDQFRQARIDGAVSESAYLQRSEFLAKRAAGEKIHFLHSIRINRPSEGSRIRRGSDPKPARCVRQCQGRRRAFDHAPALHHPVASGGQDLGAVG